MEQKVAAVRAYLQSLPEEKPVILAIDGPCTAGKTTLAARLKEQLDCNVFHMDDFFLQPHQRTQARYDQPGGNVDYERFWEEVLQPLRRGKPFSYRPFSCKQMQLQEPVQVQPKRLTIIEGTYAHHPYFGQVPMVKLFLTVEENTQKERILRRPEEQHQAFFDRWIPLEQAYFAAFAIAEKADIIL